MRTEFEEILSNVEPGFFIPSDVILQNVRKVCSYISDINFGKNRKFELTSAETLYILWEVDDLEFHIEFLANGTILYTYRKCGYGKASGLTPADAFLPILQDHLMQGIC